MIRLLVVEDSKTVQQALVGIFNSDPDLLVVGTASNGAEAVSAALALKPDLITMDINMPGMDGFEATRAIMSQSPTPIVIITSKLDPKDSATLFRVMEAGALMVFGKPAPPGHPDREESVTKLIQHIKLMAEVKVVRRIPPQTVRPVVAPPVPAVRKSVVAIGASAGGPPVLERLLSSLPPDFATPILIVQHMAEGFTENFVNWLNHSSKLPVRLATHGEHIRPGAVYVAPDRFQMQAGAGERIVLSLSAPDNGLRPSVAHLFRSVAEVYGSRSVGVILTGMGRDGAEELRLMRERGGTTIAQDRESSVVFGMPGEAIRLEGAEYILNPQEILQILVRLCGTAKREGWA